jgi:hypothetical protein
VRSALWSRVRAHLGGRDVEPLHSFAGKDGTPLDSALPKVDSQLWIVNLYLKVNRVDFPGQLWPCDQEAFSKFGLDLCSIRQDRPWYHRW